MTRTWSVDDKRLRTMLRLSITRHGVAGWRWTMLLADENSLFPLAAEFRSGEDGRGTWMRMIGEQDWLLVTPPDQRAYPDHEDEAKAEIEQVCLDAAVNLIAAGAGGFQRRPQIDLARVSPMGSC